MQPMVATQESCGAGAVAVSDFALRIADARATAIGDSFSVSGVADQLGIGVAAVERRRGRGRLYAFKILNQWRYAAWQFAGRRVVPGVPDLVSAIPPDMHPVLVRALMLAPRPALDGGTSMEAPRDYLLRGGASARVIALFEEIRRA